MNNKIKELQKQISEEQDKIRKCKHIFDKVFYNPETVRKPYGYKTVAQGSDVWMEPQGYHDVEESRWTRICKICGYEQHTNKQEPIIVGTEPKFD